MGALRSVTTSTGLLAVAVVLAPERSPRSLAAVQAGLQPAAPAPALQSAAGRALSANAMADALPVFEALARHDPAATQDPVVLTLPLSSRQSLRLELQP